MMKKTGYALSVWLALGALPSSVHACATCFGKSDSAMAQGMNMGILSLMVVIGCVLAGISSFFVFIARKSGEVDPTQDIKDRT